MVTRRILTPSLLVAGLSVGLLGKQASAADDLVAFRPQPAAIEFRIDQALLRKDIDSSIRMLNDAVLKSLDADLRRTVAPAFELASNELRGQG